MESHGDLSNPRGLQGRLKSERLWCELAKLLNCIDGGVNKPTEKWKKVWADWKSKTKKKASVIRRRASGTGGGSSSRQTLTTFEERVLATMGKLAVEEQPSIQEQGFAGPSQLLSSKVKHKKDRIYFKIATYDEAEATPPLTRTTPPSTSRQPAQASTRSRVQQAAQPAPSTTSRQPLPSALQCEVTASPTRSVLRARRRRTLTPFDRAMRKFVAVEQQRLRVEERRDRQLHERETQRIEVDHERNQILRSFADIAQACLDHFRSRHNAEH
ncbi:unnamed protein product, partial [Iphiclides podalirius]